MGRQVQLPEDLVLDLIKWHLADLRDSDTESRIRVGLQAKLDAMARRQDYATRLADGSAKS